MVLQRDFKVSSKGMKGKHKDKPFVEMATAEAEKLVIHLESVMMLKEYEIGQEFSVKILEGEQTRLVKK
jgi:hypothetical protein